MLLDLISDDLAAEVDLITILGLAVVEKFLLDVS